MGLLALGVGLRGSVIMIGALIIGAAAAAAAARPASRSGGNKWLK